MMLKEQAITYAVLALSNLLDDKTIKTKGKNDKNSVLRKLEKEMRVAIEFVDWKEAEEKIAALLKD